MGGEPRAAVGFGMVALQQQDLVGLPAMADNFGADLDQLLTQRRQPVFHGLGQGKRSVREAIEKAFSVAAYLFRLREQDQ